MCSDSVGIKKKDFWVNIATLYVEAALIYAEIRLALPKCSSACMQYRVKTRWKGSRQKCDVKGNQCKRAIIGKNK